MKLYSENQSYKLYQGNMLDMLEDIEPNSIDSVVTDPPYELNFMNKGWDNSGIAFQKSTWEKCYEVLKPGGYLLAFGGSRTFHRIACAIEDAGFEIRDTIMWLYGSGFPKSMNISKGIESKEKLGNAGTRNKRKIEQSCEGESYTVKQTNNGAMGELIETTRKEYSPSTELAKQWQGWGTCLKPSFEPIIVARKPFNGSLIDNVMEYGVGGFNIDECRVPAQPGEYDIRHYTKEDCFQNLKPKESKFQVKPQPEGRFPANTILTYDETDYDEVCGGFPITGKNGSTSQPYEDTSDIYGHRNLITPFESYGDAGSAARYFYCAKATRKDRDEGCELLSDSYAAVSNQAQAEFKRGNIDFTDDNNKTFNNVYKGKNVHPTVKPTELMQYLIRLVTPNGGTILDPFNGSGSTGKATMYENREKNKGYKYIGIELTEEYLPISKARIEHLIDPNHLDAPIKIKTKPTATETEVELW